MLDAAIPRIRVKKEVRKRLDDKHRRYMILNSTTITFAEWYREIFLADKLNKGQ